MAGSYRHAVDDDGKLQTGEGMLIATETQGDAYETIEEMYGMIWYLANGDADLVEEARVNWQVGIERSPGRREAP
jgi:hypothetical protein